MRDDAPHMLPKIRSEALLQAVREMPCTLKLAGMGGMVCGGRIDPCHLPVFGKGTGTKVSDLYVVAGCRNCHDLLDGRNPAGIKISQLYPGAWGHQLLRALCHTQALLIRRGVIQVTDMEVIEI